LEQASQKREALEESVRQRGSAEVKRALAVVASRKDKEVADAIDVAEKLREKLEAAETRRSVESREGGSSARHKQVMAARAAQDFERVVKGMAQKAAMERAEAKRASLLNAIGSAAATFNGHCADVAEMVKSNAQGTDEATAKGKATIFEKLNSAEVARAMALRKRASHGKSPGHHPEVIQVPVGSTGAGAPRAAPSNELLRRLTSCPQLLLASAAARQLGAFSRREHRLSAKHAAAVKQVGKMAAAAKRRAHARAKTLGALTARDIRSAAVLREQQEARARLAHKEAALTAMVHANRLATEQVLAAKADANDAFSEAVADRRAHQLRKTAKVGVPAVRSSAAKSRRNALASVISKNAELNQNRCMQAATNREAEIAAKVNAARRLAAEPRLAEPIE